MKSEVRKSLVVVVLTVILGMLMPAGVWAEEDNGVSEAASQQVNTGISNETQTIINESAQEMIDSAGTIAIEETEEVISTGQQQDNNTINTSMNTSEFEQKLQQFQAAYGYYNHSYYRDSDFNLASQCHGYARLLTRYVFGVECSNGYGAGWTRLYNINQVSPGDLIRYNNEGHTVFVTGVSGDTVTYTEANYTPWGYNAIRWGVQTSKSQFTGLNYIAHYSANPVVVTPPDTTPPIITNVRITDVNEEGFTVRCNISDNVGVTRVNYATWTEANGQDDLKWADGGLSGSESSYRILYRDHFNEKGSYKVDIRAYDGAGNVVGPITTGTSIDITKPVISDVEVIDQSPYGYQVKCKVTDNNGIARVQFPSWTIANGQDDLKNNWLNDSSCSGVISGDIVTYQVKDSDHNYERGLYRTHIYAYDVCGNYTCLEIDKISGDIDLKSLYLPVGQETLNQNSYYLYDDVLTWPEAKAKAEELGGHLATITTKEEQSIIEKLLTKGQRTDYVIGGTDEKNEGSFAWITGEVGSYGNWIAGNPDNYLGNENYLEIKKSGGWNDISDKIKCGFIVEKENGVVTATLSRTDDITKPSVNSNLLLKAETSEGTAPYQYRFTARLGETTTIIQDYSNSATATFKPAVPGDYTLTVEVKDAVGKIGKADMVIKVEGPVAVESFNQNEYYLYDELLTWPEAKAKAEELGGHLVSITTQEEQTVIERLMKLGQQKAYFMGGTDEGHEGTFTWITGEPFTLSKFGIGQPDNYNGKENYLEIQWEGNWNDQSGMAQRGFIVEKEKSALTVSLSQTEGSVHPTVNSKLLFKAETSGGTVPYQYRFTAKLGETTTTIQDYSETATATFKPAVPGDYILMVEVKDAAGNIGKTSIALKVEGPVVVESFNQNVYYLYDELLTWPEAKAKAESLGGHLVTITSQQEQTLVEKIVQRGKMGAYFTGGTDEGHEGTFTWITGEPFSFSKFGIGQPDNYNGKENSLEFQKGGNWNDQSSDAQRGFIVEKEKSALQVTLLRTDNISNPSVYDSLLLMAEARNGTAPYQYKFTVSFGEATTTIQDYSDKSTAMLKPVVTGDYTFTVEVKDATGNIGKTSMMIKVKGPVGEEIFNRHTYYLYDELLTWTEAKAKAETLGGHLVVITSQEEQTAIEKLLKQGQQKAYFIGGTDEGHEGTFNWITGEPFSLSKFGIGQPDNYSGKENYLEIQWDGSWNDQSGIAQRGFIVEKDNIELAVALSRTDQIVDPMIDSSLLLKGETTGGTAPYQYKFSAKLGETTTTIQDYSATATAIFKPTAVGDYILTVEVKDAAGNTGTQRMTVTIGEAPVLESKFVAFLGTDPSGNFYEYDADSLNIAYLAYQINPALASAKMYKQFANSQCSVIALKDQAKGYMDYSATANACLKAQMQGGSFDVNVYFAGSEAKVYAGTIGTVKKVDQDGNVQ